MDDPVTMLLGKQETDRHRVKGVYLDHHATTPLDPEVLDAMMPYLKEFYGNASSRSHAWGLRSTKAIEKAREQVARLIGAEEKEIIFTSGATESNNLCLKGHADRDQNACFVTSCIEHPSIIQTCRYLEAKRHSVTYLPVDSYGRLDINDVTNALSDSTSLVSIMLANHEVGTLNPIAAIGLLCSQKNVLFHTDATQGSSLLPINVDEWRVDFLSLSAHKMYGPKGVGALYIRKHHPQISLTPLLHGGGQERSLRAGTLNVAGIVGFGAAAAIALRMRDEELKRLRVLRDRFWNKIKEQIDGIVLLGHPLERLPDHLSISFPGIDAEELMLEMEDLGLSSGSACSTGNGSPSYILKNMGVKHEFIHGSIRIGLGRFTTDEEIDYAICKISETVRKLDKERGI